MEFDVSPCLFGPSDTDFVVGSAVGVIKRRRRPWPTAATPQVGQPRTSASDSTVSTNRAGCRSMVSTCISSTSNRVSVRERQSALEAHVE